MTSPDLESSASIKAMGFRFQIRVLVEFRPRLPRLEPGEDDAHSRTVEMAFEFYLPHHGIVGSVKRSAHVLLSPSIDIVRGPAVACAAGTSNPIVQPLDGIAAGSIETASQTWPSGSARLRFYPR